MSQLTRGVAIIGAGETTVRVGSANGRGGRNQELALAAALADWRTRRGVVASLGTDGCDNSATIAGALVDEQTAMRTGRELAAQHLAQHDSTTFFERYAPTSLLETGPTGTNVADLMLALGEKD